MKHEPIGAEPGQLRFVKHVYAQTELALRVLLREGVLTEAIWDRAYAEIIGELKNEPGFRPEMLPEAFDDALRGPGLAWVTALTHIEKKRILTRPARPRGRRAWTAQLLR